jgi:hypothetical protein
MTSLLTLENYSKGFLVDEDLMAGVSQHPENPELFVAFVLRHTTGEYLGYQPFYDLHAALHMINRIERSWTYERFGGCGNGNCGEGKCGEGGCCSKGACDN